MKIGLIRAFVAVAETSSFSAAGERLSLTQSTISHQVARLEEYFQRKLFERSTRSCKLTASGRAILDDARDLLERYDAICDTFKPDEFSGHLKVGVPDDYHLFAPIARAISEFNKANPSVTIEVMAGLSRTLLAGLDASGLDLALVRELPDIAAKDALLVEDLVWIGRPEIISKGRAPQNLALVTEPCYYRQKALDALDAAEIPYKTVTSSDSFAANLAFVKSGFAISVAVRGSVPDDIPILPSNIGLPLLPRVALVPKYGTAPPSPQTKALTQKIREELASTIA